MESIKILVVEDEERIRNLLKIYIEKEGYKFDEAVDGKEGLGKALLNDYTLILLDVMIPDIDGWTVCREIRKKSSVPIIMLTARSEEYDKLYGFELGVDDYIVKPFSPKEVIARIKAVLKRNSKNVFIKENPEKALKDIRINPESRQFFVQDKEVILTPKEFDLLLLLIDNPNKVFSREQLLNNIWGYDFYGDMRTVDTHIKQLREKLGKSRNYIKTIWGTGYKFSIGE